MRMKDTIFFALFCTNVVSAVFFTYIRTHIRRKKSCQNDICTKKAHEKSWWNWHLAGMMVIINMPILCTVFLHNQSTFLDLTTSISRRNPSFSNYDQPVFHLAGFNPEIFFHERKPWPIFFYFCIQQPRASSPAGTCSTGVNFNNI